MRTNSHTQQYEVLYHPGAHNLGMNRGGPAAPEAHEVWRMEDMGRGSQISTVEVRKMTRFIGFNHGAIDRLYLLTYNLVHLLTMIIGL